MSALPRIGFIGIGMMGHGMAKNLLAKGYPLTFKANRDRDRLDDLLAAGAQEAKTNAEVARGARHRLHLRRHARRRSRRSCTAPRACSSRRPQRPDRRRHLDRRAVVDRAAARRLRRGAARATSTRRWRARRRRPRKGASTPWSAPSRPTSRRSSRCCRRSARTSSTSARRAPAMCSSSSTTCWRCRRRRRSPRPSRSRPRAGSSLDKLFEVVSAGGVNSGIFQMMVGRMLQGDLGGPEVRHRQRAEGPALLHPPRRVAAGAELHGRGGAPELRAGRQPRLRRQVHRLAVRGPGADRQGPHRSAAAERRPPRRRQKRRVTSTNRRPT